MNIVKITQLGQKLYFTAVNKDGDIKIGVRPINGKKVEWFSACLK